MQKTEPHFRPERGPIGDRPANRAPWIAAAAGRPETPAATARPPIAPERSPRTISPASAHHALSRPWLPWISGAAAVSLSFAFALWLTSPPMAPPGVAVLESATVSDATSLMAAVQTAGLRGTPDVKGAVEGLKRIDDKRVTISGWAVDRTASSSALTIVAFSGGRHALTAVTNGPRKDVAQMFGLSEASARNVSFEASFACEPDQNLVIIAVTADRTYSQFRSLGCP